MTRCWRRVAVLLACALTAQVAFAGATTERVILQTTKGVIELELDQGKAPISVANFLTYVDNGFYDGLIFHRVLENFMIQAGGYDAKMNYRKPSGAITNESQNGLHNINGTIAMARQQDPDSANAQFFINVNNNPHLDFRPGAPGYTVFGRVLSGMDVVEQIESAHTGVVNGMPDVPIEPVVIVSARRVN